MSRVQASDCTPIPVAAAKSIADEYAKSLVAILGYDPGDGRVYYATYGASAVGKDLAAAMGEIAVTAVGGVLDFKQTFEDFRATPAAELKAEIERSTKERDALASKVERLREATKEAENVLAALWRRIPSRSGEDPPVRSVDFTDDQVREVYDAIAVLRSAAKGGK